MDTLGKRIKHYRTQAGLTQDELGKRVGVTASAISGWERDETKNLRLKHLFKAADALDVLPETLALEENDTPESVEFRTLFRNYQRLSDKDKTIFKELLHSLMAKKSS